MHSYRNSTLIETPDIPKVILNLYRKLNESFFGSELQQNVQILLTPGISEIVHFEPNAKFVFNRTHEETGHYNISAATLSLSPHDLCAELIHEMCHHLCFVNGIKDTSRGRMYHNKKFRDIAIDHGLTVAKDDTYGFCNTCASDKLIKWCRENIQERPADLYYYKSSNPVILKSSNSHSRKFVCPVCGNNTRSTKETSLICGLCYMDLGEIVFMTDCGLGKTIKHKIAI